VERETYQNYEELLNPLRAERHNEPRDPARRLEMAADIISTHAPKPPRSLTSNRARGGSYRPSPVALVDNREVVSESSAGKPKGRAKASKKRAS
jgi:hypothetical protein